MPKGIANISSMNETEKLHHITYDIIDRYYVVHRDKGPLCFHKEEKGLPYINIDASIYDATTIMVQTVHSNYEGFTKKDIKSRPQNNWFQGINVSPFQLMSYSYMA